jgi:signal recognition particle receptor subunit alpha
VLPYVATRNVRASTLTKPVSFCVMNKGGIVLFSKTESLLKGNPVGTLIQQVLLEERSGLSVFNCDQYNVQWTLDNPLELIFVIVYQRIASLPWLDEALELLKRAFTDKFGGRARKCEGEFPFDEEFERILQGVRERNKKSKAPKEFAPKKKPNANENADSNSNAASAEQTTNAGSNSNSNANANANANEERTTAQVQSNESNENLSNSADRLRLSRSGSRTPGQFQKKTKSGMIQPSKSGRLERSNSNANSKREPRKWDDSISASDAAELEIVKRDSNEQVDEEEIEIGRFNLDNLYETLAKEEKKKESKSRIWGFLEKLTGQAEMTEEMLAPVLANFKQHLIEKNVAQFIADELCASVEKSLLGKRPGTFNGVQAIVRAALKEALERILTPNRQINILRDIQLAKERGEPFSIVFIGVNGVGKSTNLAKVGSYLKQNGFTVMVAACDTFRSGAVEQLRVHTTRLGLPLFDQGYGSDAALIAQAAIRDAKAKRVDVVLIDTAGRMQNNAPLMKSLAKLISLNNPSLILFVGEALVGNDAVDQLTQFNKQIVDFHIGPVPRSIDGIILTKFDTIDDKVGAAVSMVYTTGQPIVFVGVGQHYTDIKRLNVDDVVQTLLQ